MNRLIDFETDDVDHRIRSLVRSAFRQAGSTSARACWLTYGSAVVGANGCQIGCRAPWPIRRTSVEPANRFGTEVQLFRERVGLGQRLPTGSNLPLGPGGSPGRLWLHGAEQDVPRFFSGRQVRGEFDAFCGRANHELCQADTLAHVDSLDHVSGMVTDPRPKRISGQAKAANPHVKITRIQVSQLAYRFS